MTRRISRFSLWVAAAGPLAVLLTALTAPWALAAATTLGGVVAQPDGPGARIQVALSGPFHYLVTSHSDRIVITLDGVASEEAAHHLAVGPVTGIFVRPNRLNHDRPPRVDVVVTTRVPLEVVGQALDGTTLVLRLAPREAAGPAPGSSVAPPAPVPPVPAEAPSGDKTSGALAGRAVIPRSMRLEAGTGQLVEVQGLKRVAVSDPQVLGVVPVSDRELLVNARVEGRTTMYIWEGAHTLLAYAVEVVSAVDRLVGLRRLLGSLFPGAEITVTEAAASGAGPRTSPSSEASGPGGSAGGLLPSGPAGPRVTDAPAAGNGPMPSGTRGQGQSAGYDAQPGTARQTAPVPGVPQGTGSALVLSGAVETQLDRQKAEEIAHAYASRIVNLLSVRHPVQIKLQVQVAELNRNAVRTLGVTWGGGQAVPGSPPSLNGGVYSLQVITTPGVGTNGLDLLIAQIQALAQRGLARLLAEPSLVVLAGRSASLLLGGQVPIPVAGANGVVTVEYKDFGVILNALPDYQEDGRIFLQITPEVSTLDFADAIKVSGFTIPALRTRRAQTVVSMLPTQTLVLGGLIQHQDTDMVQKIPLLGDLPIIGELFRSTTFQRQESDLVIFVTPVLVEPAGSAPPLNP